VGKKRKKPRTVPRGTKTYGKRSEAGMLEKVAKNKRSLQLRSEGQRSKKGEKTALK